jgi:hypothetical protein
MVRWYNHHQPMSQAEGAPKAIIVRLLECYLLDLIGALPPEEEANARRLVSKAFGKSADWKKRLRDEFGLKTSVEEQLRGMWDEAQRLAKDQGADLTPAAFAQMVVEENFVDAVEMVATELETEDLPKKN